MFFHIDLTGRPFTRFLMPLNNWFTQGELILIETSAFNWVLVLLALLLLLCGISLFIRGHVSHSRNIICIT